MLAVDSERAEHPGFKMPRMHLSPPTCKCGFQFHESDRHARERQSHEKIYLVA